MHGRNREIAEIAEIAAQLRALHTYKTPDALQLATAIHMGAQFFITNDRTLQSASGAAMPSAKPRTAPNTVFHNVRTALM